MSGNCELIVGIMRFPLLSVAPIYPKDNARRIPRRRLSFADLL